MQENEEPALCRTVMEIQKAHDLLGALLRSIVRTSELSKLPVMDLEQAYVLSARYSVLCWLLGHASREFSEYMESLEHDLCERGIVLIDTGHLHYPEIRRGH